MKTETKKKNSQLPFQIFMCSLFDTKSWSYIKSDNQVAAALMSKMGYIEKKVQVKRAFLQMLVRMKLNPAQSELVNGFFESDLKLNKNKEEQLMKHINQLDNAEEFFELPNS